MSASFFKVNRGINLIPQSNVGTGDPVGADGDIYYNEAVEKFRKFENGQWVDLEHGGDPAISDTLPVTIGATSLVVTFIDPLMDADYVPLLTWNNLTDLTPQFQPFEVTAKATTGFTVTWNAPVDSSNYTISYVVPNRLAIIITSATPHSIVNHSLAQMPSMTLKGNNTGSTADAADLTVSQITAMLNLASIVPSGVVNQYAGATAPSGYLLCDGASYPTSTYPNLYAAIGTAWGSTGAGFFNVPDMRGNFARGAIPAALQSIVGSGTIASNNATFTAHGINRSGFPVRLTSGSITGLSSGITFYAIVVDANTLAFSFTQADANAGVKISISGTNTGVLTQYMDPDAASRFANTTGGASANSVGSQQQDDFESHTHHITTGGGGANPTSAEDARNDTSNSTGATGGNETRPVNAYFNFIIKT